MKGAVAGRTTQAFAEQADAQNDTHFPNQGRLFDPVFAPSTSTLLRVISEEVAKFDVFVRNPSVANMKVACDGAGALKALMTQGDVGALDVGREGFRKTFSLTILDQVIALGASEENTALIKGVLTEDYTGASTNLCEPLTAGISDFNDRLKSLRRRAYSQDGGLCDELARQLQEVVVMIEKVKAEHGRTTSEKRDGSGYAAGIIERLGPIVAQAKELFELIPQQRAVGGCFEEHRNAALIRIADFHLPDAVKAVMGMTGDIIECKNALRVVEGIAPKVPRGRPSRRPVAG